MDSKKKHGYPRPMRLSSMPAVIRELGRISVPIAELVKVEAMIAKALERGSGLEPACAGLESFKDQVHSAFRRYALRNHPDRASDEADRERRNEELKTAIDFDKWVKTWRVAPPPKRAPATRAPGVRAPGVRGVVVYIDLSYGGGGSPATTFTVGRGGRWRGTGDF